MITEQTLLLFRLKKFALLTRIILLNDSCRLEKNVYSVVIE